VREWRLGFGGVESWIGGFVGDLRVRGFVGDLRVRVCGVFESE